MNPISRLQTIREMLEEVEQDLRNKASAGKGPPQINFSIGDEVVLSLTKEGKFTVDGKSDASDDEIVKAMRAFQEYRIKTNRGATIISLPTIDNEEPEA